MDIEYKGGNCLIISTKQTTVALDSKLSALGLKDIVPKNGFVVATQPALRPDTDPEMVVIDQPGEYEISNVSLMGIPATRMIDHDKSLGATIYRMRLGEVTLAVVGHVEAPLTEAQLEALGVVDVAVVPVGGGGYTFDAQQAVAVVKQLDPKVVIPTHYADDALAYEVPQADLAPFISELSAPAHETVSKYKIKNGALPDVLTLMEITRTS